MAMWPRWRACAWNSWICRIHRMWKRRMGRDCDSAIALNRQGNELRRVNKLVEALESYDRAIDVDPQHVPALYNRGNVLLALGRPNEALASFSRVVALD